MSGHLCPLLFRRALVVVTTIVVTCLGPPIPIPILVPAPAEAAADAVAYQPPVEAGVIDGFRPPPSPFGAGNRGVDYAAEPGQPVTAAADGVVAFAGQVGGSLHVTVLHADGIRTTYSFLQSTTVRRGDHVVGGQEVGRAGGRFHWGARAGDAYIDPRLLLGDLDGAVRAKLVPDDDRDGSPRPESEERALLAGLLRTVARTGTSAARVAPATLAWARGLPLDDLLNEVGRLAARDPSLGAWVAAATQLSAADWQAVARLLREAADADEPPCTAASVRPQPPRERRLALLVGGLGSSSASAAVTEVDTGALGYEQADVHQFSYLGGTAAENPYGAAATQGDLPEAGRRLRHLLTRLAEAQPGVPIDVIAHSQGGVVARLAAADGAPPELASIVTLGSPHQGADLAGLAVATRRVVHGRVVHDLVDATSVSPIAVSAPAVRQLAPGSSVLRDLARRPPPTGVAVVSVAARADVVVPSHRSHLPGARNVTVTVDGAHDHGELPGSPQATREVALAIAGLPPTCRSAADRIIDTATGRLISAVEQGVALDLAERTRTVVHRR